MQDPGYKIQGLGDLESWILEVRGLPAFGGSDVGWQRTEVGGRMSEVGKQGQLRHKDTRANGPTG